MLSCLGVLYCPRRGAAWTRSDSFKEVSLLRIAVCDDEKLFAQSLCSRLEAVGGGDLLISVFLSAGELLREIASGRRFDAVFLDIEMPELNGLDAARKLRESGGELSIIFLTSHTELAMEGYEVDALRFLPKDCSDKKLSDALTAIERELGVKPNIVIKQKGEEFIIPPDKIIMVEADNNTVHFRLDDGDSLSTRMKLAEALETLDQASQDFVKVHRCIIVNLAHVKKYSAKDILLDNGQTVPVSKGCVAQFRDRMFSFVRLRAR